MSFSSKIEKPPQSFSVISPSLMIQRKSVAIKHHQQQNSQKSSSQLQAQMEQAARIGHHLSQIQISSVGATVQPKLTIGQPGDRYEQEADQVAQQVMTMPQKTTLQRESMPQEEEQLQTKPQIQRMEAPKDEEEELKMKPQIQRMEAPKDEEEELKMKPELQRQMQPEEEEEIQTKSTGHPSEVMATDTLEQQLSTSKGGGSPLGNEVRAFMEPRFGADFSQVRIHDNSSANQMNQSIQAQAFTHGKDIYFNAGKYNPSSNEGKTLLAHELTHVVQQTGEK
ncbi:hypothetical protein PCC7424_2819 [Gloeothece citriformis PCC 7424]|uniref:eCIS core domain-containing protein n=1 Tax=Gloeothece citriformis (strain PCC 7424) TaxID=65393 RepID=B7K8M8_GLOC7|nr:DUF4157 domain-containing protein [Gloeothece citriformis]ACK71226.1 hypothetical protein PCC7424_2819 [Gloeothece citriformis PCC 7424]